MTIRTRLTWLFTALTATLVLIFASVIYFSAKKDREKEFYTALKKEAITKANVFLEAKVNAETLQDIYRNNREILNEVEVAIYNTEHQLLYHDAVDIDFVKETQELLNEIINKKSVTFYQDDWQVVGILYETPSQNYIITAAGYDLYGYNKLNNIFQNTIVAFLIAIAFIFLSGWYLSKKAFEPVSDMILKARKISASRMDLRLDSRSGDELGQLAQTFNEMLNRLEQSFNAQKDFVSNISHELRTPLAAIITELELADKKEPSSTQYKTIIKSMLEDARKLVKLSNSLLDLAKASYDPAEITFKAIRIDEVVLDACEQVQKSNLAFHTSIDFDIGEEESTDNELMIKGNDYLLRVAFANLIENGCKFSPQHKTHIKIRSEHEHLSVEFTDYGIGIPKEDLQQIFNPFFRGMNNQYSPGNGIGLYLSQKIIQLHQGTIHVASEPGKQTVFSVKIPLSRF